MCLAYRILADLEELSALTTMPPTHLIQFIIVENITLTDKIIISG